jgi:threonine synthase
MAAALRCPVCGNTYADRWRCECTHPLDFAEQPLPDGPAPTFAEIDTREGLWALADFHPVARRVTLGEGWTPLVGVPEWDASFKLESVFPTGSFKDRGAAMVVSRAVELGVERVVEDSSGNAGAAIATYAARAGIDARIFVPTGATAAKLRAIERAGADAVRVDGSRADVTAACTEAVEAGEGWYASHAWRPAFYAGTRTVAFEIAAQRDWSVPEAVVLPLGHGTLLLGAYRGVRALREAGWVNEIPRLLAAQATGYAPIAAEIHGEEKEHPNEAADGIHIRKPARREAIVRAIEGSGGDAVAVGEGATQREHDRLARAGFHVEPTCATATAALRAYRERGVLDPGVDVVVALTGSGLKA